MFQINFLWIFYTDFQHQRNQIEEKGVLLKKKRKNLHKNSFTLKEIMQFIELALKKNERFQRRKTQLDGAIS